MKRVRKKGKNFLSIIVVSIIFIIMLFALYENITLKQKRDELNTYLEEYRELTEEIASLKEIKQNYDIAEKNNKELEAQKGNLEKEIKELNDQISTLNKKIDNLK